MVPPALFEFICFPPSPCFIVLPLCNLGLAQPLVDDEVEVEAEVYLMECCGRPKHVLVDKIVNVEILTS
jgi:hypothetical protein